MTNTPNRWIAIPALLTLGAMLGCQGVSTGNSSTQPPPVGQLSAAPTSISFGNVQTGTKQSQSVSLKNTGQASLTLAQAAVVGAGFSTNGLSVPLTLGAGQTASFDVVFAPTATGGVSGSLNLTCGGQVLPVNIPLSGTGVDPGNLTTNPTSFDFGDVVIGTTQTQTETVKNTGGASLTVTAATVGGAFSVSGLSLPLTLAANQSSTFGVRFTPAAAGAANATLSLTVSGSSTTVDVALSGTGVTPGKLTASPTSFTFSNVVVGQSQTQTETLQNTGGVNVTISQASASGTGFSISGITLPVTLAPGQGTSFSVKFAPQSAGSFSGSISITSDGSNPNLTIGLSGTAVAPTQNTLSVTTPIAVGNVVVGTSGTATGTLTASGGTVTVSSVTMGGTNAAEFSVSGLSFPVTVTTSTPVNFTVKFTPGAAGAATATASFASDASNSPAVATLTGTGTANPATLNVTTPIAVGNVVVGTSGTATGTLTASGGTVTVSSVNMGGTNPSEFSISGLSFPVTVTTSTPVNFTVKFTPGATGAASATASFASNASNSPAVASLTGTGTPAPVHTVLLNWTPSTTSGITSYNVYRVPASNGVCGTFGSTPYAATAGTVTTYTDPTLTDGDSYCYGTTAVDANGESALSNVVQVSIPPP
jgi:hypothetical protein